MWEHSGKVAFAGVGHSPVSRRWDGAAETSLGALTKIACMNAIADAGLNVDQIDAVFSSPGPLGETWAPRLIPPAVASAFQFPNSGDVEDGISKVTAEWLAANLGMKDLKLVQTMNGFVSVELNAAIDAVAEGHCSCVVVFRPLNNFEGRYGQSGPLAQAQAKGRSQFDMPYGFAGPASYASYFSRYLHKYGQTHEKMADFAVNNRRNGLMLEYGYYYQNRPDERLTKEDYLAGRWISEPVNIYDCDLPVMAVGAFVITTAEHARNLKHPPVYVLGRANVNNRPRSVTSALEDLEESNFRFGKRVWEDAGVGPRDVGFISLYDGYTVMTPLWLEAFGICGRGEALDWLSPGHIAIEGSLPLNTSGGNNGAGRTHGVSHHYDAILQIQGRAGPRQVKNSHLGLVETGPPPAAGAHVLSRTPSI